MNSNNIERGGEHSRDKKTSLPKIERTLVVFCTATVFASFCVTSGKAILEWPNRGDLFWWAGAFAAILAILGFARRKRPQLATVVLATLAGLYLAESFLCFYNPDEYEKIPPNAPPGFDTRHRAQVALDLRATGLNAYPYFSLNRPTLKKGSKNGLIPLSGMAGVWTVFNNESGRHEKFFSDEFGFNNPAGWSRLPKGNTIALVGDSYAQGFGVEPDASMAARLNTRLNTPEKQAISLGSTGASPLCELGMVVEYLRRMEPKYVFWCFYEGNDMIDLEGDTQTALINYVEDASFTQQLWNRQAEVDQLWSERMKRRIPIALARHNSPKQEPAWWRWVVLDRVRGIIFNGPRWRIPLPQSSTLELFSRVLHRADEEVSSWGGKLIFVYLPSYHHYNPAEPQKKMKIIHNQVLEIIRSQNLELIDLHEEVFVPSGDPLSFFPFRRKGHYTAEGYDQAANAMFKRLQEFNTAD